MNSGRDARHAPRVVLRKAIEALFDGMPVLVLELGTGGARFEHPQRLDVGRRGLLICGTLAARACVRHSEILPTQRGVVFQTGVEFTGADPTEAEEFYKLLIDEAQEQVKEWEANLSGVRWAPNVIRRSAVARRFIILQLGPKGWQRRVTTDPNQPMDGISVIDDTPEEEIQVLCRTYQSGDEATRELLRRMGMLAILERLHQGR